VKKKRNEKNENVKIQNEEIRKRKGWNTPKTKERTSPGELHKVQ
tara:strand:- start:170083 stop:170214 length:132 start_codon:yes stop_codon:yes gene_type:complete